MRGSSSLRRREAPLKRVNPSGKTVWVARYTNSAGKRKSAGTFTLKGPCAKQLPGQNPECCAQHAIDAAYALPERFDTFGAYFETWTIRHPRSERTNRTNQGRIHAMLDVEIDGRPLRDWPFPELRRRHMAALIDHMLRVQGRAQAGAVGIRNTISAMVEDAITDEVAEVNFAKGVKIRARDPRIRKKAKKVRVWSFDQLREFAATGLPEIRAQTERPEKHRTTGETLFYSRENYEPLLLTFALTNLRLGEVLALLRPNLDFEEGIVRVVGNAHEGVITEGDSDEKKHVRDHPLAPSLVDALRPLPPRIDTKLLFPTPAGRVFRESNFHRDVWTPAQIASGMDARPHECRHSWITHMRAAGIDPADLAQVSGHDIDTATRHYTHPLGQSMDAIKAVLG